MIVEENDLLPGTVETKINKAKVNRKYGTMTIVLCFISETFVLKKHISIKTTVSGQMYVFSFDNSANIPQNSDRRKYAR